MTIGLQVVVFGQTDMATCLISDFLSEWLLTNQPQ